MTPFFDDHLERLRRDLHDHRTQAGKYLLGKEIGRGGMAVVYEAEDIDLGRKVALKALSNRENRELVQRMMQEARIVAQLEHASIVPIHDVGTLPDGRPYYTMKLVIGKTLAEAVREGRSIRDMLAMFERVCDAIAFAHSRGVIHRDLTPSNIMIGEFGQILVMDWGIARAVPAAESDHEKAGHDSSSHDSAGTLNQSATIDGAVMGTPAFMAPEQARGESACVGKQSDIYSLGAVLFFILTGRPPIEGDKHDVLRQVAAGLSVTPRSFNRTLPKPLAAICTKAMALSPKYRYPSAEALALDIRKYLDREPVEAYRENLFEKLLRFVAGNKLIVAIVLVYALTRLLIYLVSRL